MTHNHILVGEVAGNFAGDMRSLEVRTEQALEYSTGPPRLLPELARSLHL